MAWVALGLFLGYLLLGQVPGVGPRVEWAPQRSWISVSIFAIFISVLWGLWAWQQWHEEQLEAPARTEAQLRLLQAQIEPHFLFNTLANVQSLMDHDLPKAQADAGQLHRGTCARQPGQPAPASTAPLGQELELALHYLQLLQGRMEDRLRFRDQRRRGRACPAAAAAAAAAAGGERRDARAGAQHRGRHRARAGRGCRAARWQLEVQDDGLRPQRPAPPRRTQAAMAWR